MLSFDVVIASIGLFLTAIGLIFAGRQIQASQKVARGEFLLHLDELFHQHHEVHARLRPGGDYASGRSKPTTVEEWIAIERYMGLFERIKVLVDDKIIDLETVDRLFGYRVDNIVGNEAIRQVKLEQEKDSWGDFIDLWRALEKNRQRHLRQN